MNIYAMRVWSCLDMVKKTTIPVEVWKSCNDGKKKNDCSHALAGLWEDG